MLAVIRAWWSARKADAVVHRWCQGLAAAIRKGDLDDVVRTLSPLLDHKQKSIEVSWGGHSICFSRIDRLFGRGYFYSTDIDGVDLIDKAKEIVKKSLVERARTLYRQERDQRRQEEREKQRELAERLTRS